MNILTEAHKELLTDHRKNNIDFLMMGVCS